MRINPGGRLAGENIVGREREIARYWKILDRQGLVLAGERRIGKTHIMAKMHEVGRPGFVTIYQELEAVHSLTELVRAVYVAVGSHLSRSSQLKATAVEVWSTLLPKRIGALDLPTARESWKQLLTSALTDTLAAFDDGEKLVLMWDELPLMVHNIKEREGADSAIQLLDLLRHLRQTHAGRLRFVFTGSVGLHLVLRALRAKGNANAPMNDMQQETVPPMSDADTRELATRLLCDLDPVPARKDHITIAAEIARAVGGFPYYIQHVVDQLSQLDRAATPADVARAVDTLLLADHDPANFHYNDARIGTYYDDGEARLARRVLDVIAASDVEMAMPEIVNRVRHQAPETADEAVRSICVLLRQDHYLTLSRQGSAGLHDFRWPILKRWWKETRL
ncbi:MAG: hypothetical protein ABJE95_27875 [Byssovorax sp.]